MSLIWAEGGAYSTKALWVSKKIHFSSCATKIPIKCAVLIFLSLAHIKAFLRSQCGEKPQCPEKTLLSDRVTTNHLTCNSMNSMHCTRATIYAFQRRDKENKTRGPVHYLRCFCKTLGAQLNRKTTVCSLFLALMKVVLCPNPWTKLKSRTDKKN